MGIRASTTKAATINCYLANSPTKDQREASRDYHPEWNRSHVEPYIVTVCLFLSFCPVQSGPKQEAARKFLGNNDSDPPCADLAR